MRKLLLVAVLLLWASPARAIPIVADNFDTLVLGAQIASSSDPFTVASPPPNTMGLLESSVWFDGSVYTYVSTVTPSGDNNSHLNTAFAPAEFTGSLGFSFSQSGIAGGTGTALDFLTGDINGRLHWLGLDQGIGANWDQGEAITFFFRSTAPPRLGDYNLLNGEAGTAQGFAPVPEPGSLMLLGSGIVGLIARQRRKKRAVS